MLALRWQPIKHRADQTQTLKESKTLSFADCKPPFEDHWTWMYVWRKAADKLIGSVLLSNSFQEATGWCCTCSLFFLKSAVWYRVWVPGRFFFLKWQSYFTCASPISSVTGHRLCPRSLITFIIKVQFHEDRTRAKWSLSWLLFRSLGELAVILIDYFSHSCNACLAVCHHSTLHLHI